MSQPPIKPAKPQPDRYTVMLLIALVALIIACIFLYLQVASHGPDPLSGLPSASLLPQRLTEGLCSLEGVVQIS